MTRIDAYTHFLPPDFYETIATEHGITPFGGAVEFLMDVEARFEVMARHDVDRQVVTLALPPIWRALDHETALTLTRQANDELRELADDHDAFIPVGTVPAGGEAFADEARRCLEDLDMAGIQLFSNIGGEPVDTAAMHPVYEAIAAADAPVWLHPQDHDWYPWISDYLDDRVFAWPFDTTLALSRLVFGGIMDAYDLTVVSHHAGGMLPFYGGRLAAFFEARAEAGLGDVDWDAYERPIDGSFRSFLADTAVGGSVGSLELAIDYFDDGNVVFGSDYPFGADAGERDLRRNVETIEAADLTDAQRAGIYAGNVEAILP